MKAQSAYFSLSNDTGYDALEVHTVQIFLDDYADQLSAGEEISEGSSIIWSLYGHTPNEGLECIGDFNSFEAACEVAEKLGGKLFPKTS
jgi:hypothetical protein